MAVRASVLVGAFTSTRFSSPTTAFHLTFAFGLGRTDALVFCFDRGKALTCDLPQLFAAGGR